MPSELLIRSVNISLLGYSSLVAIAMMTSFRRDMLSNRSQRLFFSKIAVATFCMICYVDVCIRGMELRDPLNVVLLSLSAIVLNLIARSGSLTVSSFIMGKIPDGYDRWSFVKLLTWGGLRGGLSIALAMSTWDFLPPDTYYILLGSTYAIVFFTTVVQGLSVKSVYDGICRRLAKTA